MFASLCLLSSDICETNQYLHCFDLPLLVIRLRFASKRPAMGRGVAVSQKAKPKKWRKSGAKVESLKLRRCGGLEGGVVVFKEVWWSSG